MKKSLSIIVCLLLASLKLIAQPWIKNNSSYTLYTQRIERVLALTDPNNEALKIIYDSSGRTYTITDIVNEAVINNKIAVYKNNDDSMILMDNQQILQLLSYTYDSTATKQTLLIDNIVIAEYWSIDHNSGKMLRDYKWFQLCSYKDVKSGISIPLYKLSTDGFMTLCKPYYVLVGNDKTSLKTYFEDRLYKSNIISVKKIDTKTYGDPVPQIPDTVLEEMLNR